MTKVLYGVSPIGLGHAARAVAVGEELKRMGVDVTFATGRNATDFIESYGFVVEEAIDEPVPKVVSGEMKNVTSWYFRYWVGYKRSRGRMAKLFNALQPDTAVGDEEFSGLLVAAERGRKNILITDELQLGFARGLVARVIEARAERWYRGIQRSVNLLIIPEDGADSGNVRHVGPIVRRVTSSRDRVVDELSLPRSGRMVLLSMSGTGLGEHLIAPTVEAVRRLGDAYLVVTGNRRRKLEGEGIYDVGVVRENQNLVAAADLVVSAAGKSTIDEALSAGTPIVAIPFRNHAEQERNAKALGYDLDDLPRLGTFIRERIGRRTEPRSCEGARRAAELIFDEGA